VKVLYFAGLREAVGLGEEQIALPPGVTTVGALREHLAGRGASWAALIAHRNLKAAVNHRMVGPDAPVAEGDEVAFFPPVTGG
jgi:molybdopterin synthase sulfur carrier subunit